jgi:hypothetical protein
MSILVDPRALALTAIEIATRPPPPADLNAWAEANIVFGRESPFPGPYRRETIPPVARILECLGAEPSGAHRHGEGLGADLQDHGRADLHRRQHGFRSMRHGLRAPDPRQRAALGAAQVEGDAQAVADLAPHLRRREVSRQPRHHAVPGDPRRPRLTDDLGRQLAGLAVDGVLAEASAGRPVEVGGQRRRRPGTAERQSLGGIRLGQAVQDIDPAARQDLPHLAGLS